MSEKTAKLIFWVGTLTSLVLFLVLTVDTHGQIKALTRADEIDDQVVSGKKAFERHNCNDCHTILGFGGYYAPDLTRAYSRMGESGIRRRLKEPEVVFADSYRKMPQQHLADEEISALVTFLKWVSRIDNHDWPPQHSDKRWKRSTQRLIAGAHVSPGAALIIQEDCLSCHKMGDDGELQAEQFGWIGAKRSSQWIADYIADPEKYAKGTEMPAFDHLSLEQRLMVGETIVALAAGKAGAQ